MELLDEYQKLKQHVVSEAKKHSIDTSILKELEKFETLLEEQNNLLKLDSEKYKMLFENSGDYIFVLSEEGTILEVNSTACSKYGIPREELINTSVLEIDASENREYIMQKIEELLRKGRTRFEALHRNRNGEIFTVDVIAQRVFWNSRPAIMDVCRDITEQKQLERALNDSEIKLKKIINQISDGIIIFEKHGKVMIWNSGAEKITGIKKEEAIGRLLFELQYELLYGKFKDKDFIRQRFREIVDMSKPEVFNMFIENEIYVPAKGVRNIQAIIFPIELEKDSHLFGTVLRDVTEQKNAEKQLLDLNATKDKIFSIIAHDLRTPFNSIIGFTDLLLDNFDNYDTDRIRKIVQFINLSAKPTLDVLTNLLNWVNAQTGQIGFRPELCRLDVLVQSVLEIMNPTANIKNIMLSHDLSEDLEVFADVNMLKSVLQNLIANAIKFSHAGGKVEIHARKAGEYIEMEVTDEGIGIDDKRKEALFRIDSHVSTKGTSGEKGSGLGLILCKEFIDKHGGEIRVESRPGDGSKFLFTLPIVHFEANGEKSTNEIKT